MRVMLVDDERLARSELRRLLAAHAQVEIVAEAANGQEALALYADTRPDVVFLDIEMPGMRGLDLACALDGEARLVFCTAYPNFAVDAFDLQAVDYLVKPVAPARLAQTLARLGEAGTDYLPDDHRVLLKRGDHYCLVRLGEVQRLDSADNYVQLTTPTGRFLLQGSLARLAARLDPRYFFQASRSTVVRFDAIVSLSGDVGLGLTAHLADGSEVAVSRRQAKRLRERFSL